ncbi:MAG: thiamine-phosphate kinase [Pontiellaceae bacterium]|nr:thiamine-phosphate kinase [Pontiellaceae bacterium]
MKTLGEIGEHEAIRRLVAGLGAHPDLAVGVGDDCAVARIPGSNYDQVFTSDPVIEHVHFLPSHAPERIGNKAVGRVLSDLAAMGAQPQWIVVNVVAPPELNISILEEIYSGMNALCRRFGATIIGGDLAQGEQLELHLFGTGILPSGTALLRSGARSGDQIFVSGPLGCSIAGHHLDFVPRVEEGIFLRESVGVGALMDVSDGLATDLRHILAQSGVGAELDVEHIPKNGTLEQALYDGEDFELLFTVRPDASAALKKQWTQRFGASPICIGRVTPHPDTLALCFLDGSVSTLENKGFEHFSGGRE